jgi:hypothetical protein
MYKAYVGLRNFRIQTIKSTQQALRNLYDKRTQKGYRYREKLYEVQQAEAQRGMLSRA